MSQVFCLPVCQASSPRLLERIGYRFPVFTTSNPPQIVRFEQYDVKFLGVFPLGLLALMASMSPVIVVAYSHVRFSVVYFF